MRTNEERRPERKARLARQAVTVLAIQSAKNAVKNHIRAQGLKLWDFSSADLTLWAEIWLREHPEMITEAKTRAVELGYAIPRSNSADQ